MSEDLLTKTLAAATKDVKTTDRGGAPKKDLLLDGMRFNDTAKHYDDRGWLVEGFDARLDWHQAPYTYGYLVCIKPGVIKGWALHKTHEDRYYVVKGVMEMVTFDPRPDSSTYGRVSRIVLSADRPRIINIPAFVWHADHNIGGEDCWLMNFPTAPYDHDNPDKFRLPLDTDLIPFSFGPGARGW